MGSLFTRTGALHFCPVCRTGEEDVDVTVSIVTPRYIQAVALGIDRNLGKSIGALQRIDGEHDGCRMRSRARRAKAFPHPAN